MKNETELQQQAEEILEWSRRKLATKLPEFYPALYLLVTKESEQAERLWTDGEYLYYHPETVIKDYLARKDEIAMQILHIVIHGLMGHFTKRRGSNAQIFDAAADLKACEFMSRLKVPFARRWKAADERTLREFELISLEVACQLPESQQEAAKMIETAEPFQVDNHSAWIKKNGNSNGNGNAASLALEKMWRDAAVQVAQRMSGGKNRQFGSLAGELCEEFRNVPESTVSYSELIRQFCSARERQEVDPDSINAIWYHVGMELTGDAPIVEPEEVREDAPAMELAVALDTSGSCGGEIMQGFLSELLAILRDAGGPNVEFTLIQCDAEIQSVQNMTREDTVEQIMAGMKISGFGGTDFQPVFEYIDRENCLREGNKFRGLLYLSDGYGSFPRKKPDYPVIFLFPRGELYDEMVPSWVTTAHITDDQRLIVNEKEN